MRIPMTRQSILLVDDEKVLRLSLQSNLKREGFEVASAESAETAITLLRHRSYDLLLTDYLMEGINGVELMRQARELYPDINVIVFSGYAEENLADQITRLGADAFFCKPIEFEDLLKLICKIVPQPPSSV